MIVILRSVPYPDYVAQLAELEREVEEGYDLADLYCELYTELRGKIDRYSEQGPEKVITNLEAALASIAANTCCDGCREAARAALATVEEENT